jgi:glutamate decarboxylase
MENCQENAAILREGIAATGRFDILSKDTGVPLVAFSLKDSSRFSVFDISENLRRFSWIVPAYTMPADAEHVAVLRIVIREDFSRSLSERLVSDIRKILHELDARATHAVMVSTATATATAAQSAGEDGGVVAKKSVLEIEREVAARWRNAVNKKKTGVC